MEMYILIYHLLMVPFPQEVLAKRQQRKLLI